jgi:hypothetical protein
MRLRNPGVRQGLLRDLGTLKNAVSEPDEILLGDAIEEVWHLLDPSHGGEPGDILLDDAEVALGTRVWRALERAPWPSDPETRATHRAWAEVSQRATAFVDQARAMTVALRSPATCLSRVSTHAVAPGRALNSQTNDD